MAPKVCVNKLKKEMRAFLADPPPHVPAVHVNEKNMLEWHYLIEGPPDTPYAGGMYIGKLRFPPEYPFKPPAIMMLTPNGRFETNTRICMSMSDYHPETWNPLWSVASILTGLLSFMLEDTVTAGYMQTTDEQKKQLASESVAWVLRNKQLAQMFPQLQPVAEQGPSAYAPATPPEDGDPDASCASQDAGVALENLSLDDGRDEQPKQPSKAKQPKAKQRGRRN
ncbi:UBC-like protein [Coccomyxa subellipsoidea C-169]|uniref:UBC-like protein n=1 Tax=Coccomyxa subellipsoidea (strain C-169) TaxID=574566 RepID=I0YYD5_COCSC|nr:UBC-like protein [Coccomyxa subellipsoidea C-169]EIE23404.1 UBC-like protein [Coccomyxa subellipsoidea C-169]|eukprot:XP_005647948.1 UBC-like protein [Coccomyxa subellipsoidea C-169]